MEDTAVDHLTDEDLSGAVAREVLGWTQRESQWVRHDVVNPSELTETPPPDFATNHASAAKLFRLFHGVDWRWETHSDNATGITTVTLSWSGGPRHRATGETFAQAMCRVLLKTHRAIQ